jgi:hypothetical protein
LSECKSTVEFRNFRETRRGLYLEKRLMAE